jgi:hypothetical protein
MEGAIALSNRSAANTLRTRRLGVPIALGGYAALVVAAFAWGRSLAASGAGIAINAPPLFGRFDVRVSWRVIPVALVAVAAVAYLPTLSARLKFSRLLVVSMIAAFLWAGALAFVDGSDGFLGALQDPRDYLAAVPLGDSPLSFLSDFTENLGCSSGASTRSVCPARGGRYSPLFSQVLLRRPLLCWPSASSRANKERVRVHPSWPSARPLSGSRPRPMRCSWR